MADALIALGGNVGDVRATFKKAIPTITTAPAASTAREGQESPVAPGEGKPAEVRPTVIHSRSGHGLISAGVRPIDRESLAAAVNGSAKSKSENAAD